MTAIETSPGVRFPPPLVFAIALVLGLLMDRWWPAPIGELTLPARLALGAPFLLSGLALDVWAALTLHRARTTVLPWAGASALVTTGPYRFTRNPIYLGYALETIGASLMLGALWPLALLPFAIVATDRLIIRREERHLATRFGDEFEDYVRRVRRWI